MKFKPNINLLIYQSKYKMTSLLSYAVLAISIATLGFTNSFGIFVLYTSFNGYSRYVLLLLSIWIYIYLYGLHVLFGALLISLLATVCVTYSKINKNVNLLINLIELQRDEFNSLYNLTKSVENKTGKIKNKCDEIKTTIANRFGVLLNSKLVTDISYVYVETTQYINDILTEALVLLINNLKLFSHFYPFNSLIDLYNNFSKFISFKKPSKPVVNLKNVDDVTNIENIHKEIEKLNNSVNEFINEHTKQEKRHTQKEELATDEELKKKINDMVANIKEAKVVVKPKKKKNRRHH